MSTAPTTAPTGSAEGWSRPLALVVALAFFMENLDATILITATPSIAADYGVAAADLGLAVTAYLVAVAAFIPFGSWLADRLGARAVFLSSVVVFTLASAWCAASDSVATLTCARVLQGIAGSMLVPVGRLVVLRGTAKADLVRAIAYLTWPALVAPVIAPLLGGLLTEHAGWPWIFWGNVPIGVVLALAAWRIVPPVAAVRRPLDVVGLVLMIVTVTALVLGLEFVADPARAVTGSVLLVAAVLVGTVAVRWVRRAAHPVLDLGTLRIATFRVSNSAGSVYRAVVSAAPFLLPLLLQDGFGWSPVQAGAMLMAVFAGNLGIKPVTTPLMRRVRLVPIVVVSTVVLAATFVAAATLTPDTPSALVAALFVVSGAARSVGFTAYNTLQFADVPPAGIGPANAVASITAQLATGLGVAVAALLVRSAVALVPGQDAAFGYRVALVAMAAVGLASLVETLFLPRGAGDAVRAGRR
ncbi:MFS transporter [Kineococcus sp. SYSU DK003]|uniref:MFS transporter n=1 Tax=Kineococcus sp. SYSU DK003 TaxID=3383124 RepID=UPI003D7D730C